MSRTDGQSTGGPLDVFRTPDYCTRVLMEHVTFRGPRVLDAGCGDGAILKVLHAGGIPLRRLAVTDIRPQPSLEHPDLQFHWGDFLEHHGEYSSVLGNPPYGGRTDLAARFVRHALTLVPKGGRVCMLLRLPWMCGGEFHHQRSTWLRANMPSKIIAFDKRPSFDGNGTDGTDYAWFIWVKGENPPYSQMILADCRQHL